MAETYHKVHKYRDVGTDNNGEVVSETTEVVADSDPMITRLQMVVRFITGFIAGLLTLRFLLALFGANQNNGFVDLVYTLSSPLISPFRGLFNLDASSGAARFEADTLFAIVLYLIIGAGIVKLLDIFRSRNS